MAAGTRTELLALRDGRRRQAGEGRGGCCRENDGEGGCCVGCGRARPANEALGPRFTVAMRVRDAADIRGADHVARERAGAGVALQERVDGRTVHARARVREPRAAHQAQLRREVLVHRVRTSYFPRSLPQGMHQGAGLPPQPLALAASLIRLRRKVNQGKTLSQNHQITT